MKNLLKNNPGWTFFLCLLGITLSWFLFTYEKVINGIVVLPLFVFLGLLCVESIKRSPSYKTIARTKGNKTRIFHIKSDNKFSETISVIFFLYFGLIFFMGPSDREYERNYEKNIVKACSEIQMKKTGTEKCKQEKDYLKKWYIDTPLRKINEEKEEYGYPKVVKKLEEEAEKKCSESGLKQFGTEGCEKAKLEFQKKTQRWDYLKTEKERIEKRIKELEKSN